MLLKFWRFLVVLFCFIVPINDLVKTHSKTGPIKELV